ncbi:MAG: type II toxin-antitoxin system VapC family toxin [Pyrinomonadaceae bacterium]|nr:type II toxin-antitoxin system VapC family toxin [Pyrinomonadaceae bacterium]
MKPAVYLEASIISYLTAYQSRDVIVLARQKITEDWWEHNRQKYELFVSDLVEQEASAGNVLMSKRRLKIIKTLKNLATSEKAVELAEILVKRKAVPENSVADALHIAIATVEQMNFLLTWNFKHIANAQMQSKIEKVCRDEGFEPVTICTPEELLGE